MFKWFKCFSKNNKSDFEADGEVYKIDEIGDDEKYVFLTKISDGTDKQIFNISDELYNQILNDRSIDYLVYENNEFRVK